MRKRRLFLGLVAGIKPHRGLLIPLLSKSRHVVLYRHQPPCSMQGANAGNVVILGSTPMVPSNQHTRSAADTFYNMHDQLSSAHLLQ